MKELLQRGIVGLTTLVLLGSAGCQMPNLGQENKSPLLAQSEVPTRSPRPEPNLSLDAASPDYVAKIVQEVGPAVVRIDSSRVVEDPFGPMGGDPFFGGRPQAERVQRGTGSGFIVSSDGRVLTNAHVVEGADAVTVLLEDGRRFKGTVVGTDRTTDVAVIKIDGQGLPVAKTGDSDNLLPGQAAIAIGNPLGLNYTVTQGIISATGRSGADFGGSAQVNFIQTDTAINPGNSGGPLINSKGEVIGINTAIIQGASGIGFAVPIRTAQRIAEQIVTKGSADHPYLGIQMAALTPQLREQINQTTDMQVNQDEGVIVIAIQPNSPAAVGGLRPGDIIEAIGSTPVATPNEVRSQVAMAQINQPLEVQVKRSGASRKVTVKPAPMPNNANP